MHSAKAYSACLRQKNLLIKTNEWREHKNEKFLEQAAYACKHRPWGCRADLFVPCRIWLRKDMDAAGGSGLQRFGAAVSEHFQVEEQVSKCGNL